MTGVRAVKCASVQRTLIEAQRDLEPENGRRNDTGSLSARRLSDVPRFRAAPSAAVADAPYNESARPRAPYLIGGDTKRSCVKDSLDRCFPVGGYWALTDTGARPLANLRFEMRRLPAVLVYPCELVRELSSQHS